MITDGSQGAGAGSAARDRTARRGAEAELRLLPMLSTHLPLHESAAEMYLPPHTVKAREKLIYRKPGAASRVQVLARARELGLLED